MAMPRHRRAVSGRSLGARLPLMTHHHDHTGAVPVVPQILSFSSTGIVYAALDAPQTQFLLPPDAPAPAITEVANEAIAAYGAAAEHGVSPIPPATVIVGTVSKPAGEWLA